MKRDLLAGVLAVLAVLSPAGPAAGAGAGKASTFEYPVVPAGSAKTVGTGDFVGPWEVIAGEVDVDGRGTLAAMDGVQVLDLGGDGAIRRAFVTRAGKAYEFGYWLAGNPCGDAIKSGTVGVGDQAPVDFYFNATGKTATDMGYVHKTIRFRATGAETTAEFHSTTTTACGPVLDAITMRPVFLP